MRWDGLFADLEAQLASGQWEDTEREAAELTRGERAAIPLADRLRGAIGRDLVLRLTDGQRLTLTLSAVGGTWVGGTDAVGSVVVDLGSVVAVDGALGSADPEPSRGRRQLGIGSVYRALARARAGVSVSGAGGLDLGEGTIDRVGLDHFDLAVHPRDEFRRDRSLRGYRVIPFAAVQTVRSAYASSV